MRTKTTSGYRRAASALIAGATLLVGAGAASATTPKTMRIVVENKLSASAPDMPAYPQLSIRATGQSLLWAPGDLAGQGVTVRRGATVTLTTKACDDLLQCVIPRSSTKAPSYQELGIFSRSPALGWGSMRFVKQRGNPLLWWQDTAFPSPTRGYMLDAFSSPAPMLLGDGRSVCVTASGFIPVWPLLSENAKLTLTFTDTCPAATTPAEVTAAPAIRVTARQGTAATTTLSGAIPAGSRWEAGRCTDGETIKILPAEGEKGNRVRVRRSGRGHAHCFALLVADDRSVSQRYRIRIFLRR